MLIKNLNNAYGECVAYYKYDLDRDIVHPYNVENKNGMLYFNDMEKTLVAEPTSKLWVIILKKYDDEFLRCWGFINSVTVNN